MHSQRHLRPLMFAAYMSVAAVGFAQSSSPAPLIPVLHDGNHDFDSLFGNFTFHLHYMLHPLTSTPGWTDMAGTGSCYKVWDGRANLDTVELDSANGGHIEGLTLRLYDRDARQWRLYWANSRIGRLDPPQVGDFRDGHGDFYTTDTINGKVVLIRYDWTRMNSGTPHFEQAFSPDGGKTWEVNWITDQTAPETPSGVSRSQDVRAHNHPAQLRHRNLHRAIPNTTSTSTSTLAHGRSTSAAAFIRSPVQTNGPRWKAAP